MKFRRRPIDRSIVDALDAGDCYIVQREPGKTESIPKADFERDYQPAHASPKPKKPRKKRGEGAAT